MAKAMIESSESTDAGIRSQLSLLWERRIIEAPPTDSGRERGNSESARL